MIQINLIPDIKQELIRAKRQRNTVVSFSIIATIAAIGLAVILALYVHGAQTLRDQWSDNQIRDLSSELSSVEDLSNTLTIQKQLELLPELHENKSMSSRLFLILSTINPPEPNNMTMSTVRLLTDDELIEIEGYAMNGYSAVEVFKKTIESTKVHIGTGDDETVVNLTDRVEIEQTSYGESSEGARVLRFTISFAYDPDVLSGNDVPLRVVAPTGENATDSYRRLPQSLFGRQASDIEEAN